MFRRSKTDSRSTTALVDQAATAGATTEGASTALRGPTPGKGRPTPTRKEAEAASRARAKVPRTRKEQNAAQRLARSESSAKMREAMRTGEERHLLPRDKGAVRRFCRDYIDSHFTIVELAIPIMFVFLVPGFFGSAIASISQIALLITLLVMIVAVLVLRRQVLREVRKRFPDVPTKGLTYYILTRASQMRFMRMPKPQVRRGEALREHYR